MTTLPPCKRYGVMAPLLILTALLAISTPAQSPQPPALVDHFIVLENSDQPLGTEFFQFYLREYFRGYFAEPHHYFDITAFQQDDSKDIRARLIGWWNRPRRFYFDVSDQQLFQRHNQSDGEKSLFSSLFSKDKAYYNYRPIHRYDNLAYAPGRFLQFEQILPEEMPDPSRIRGYVEEYLEKTTSNWAPRRVVTLEISRQSLVDAGIPETEVQMLLEQCRMGNALFLDHRGILHFGEFMRPSLADWHNEFAALSPAEQRRYSATAYKIDTTSNSDKLLISFSKGFGMNPERALIALLLPDQDYWQRQRKTPFYIAASRRGASTTSTHYETLLTSMINGAGIDAGAFFPYRPKGLELSFRSYLLRWRDLCRETPPIYIPAYSLWKVGYRASLPSRDPNERIAPVLPENPTVPLAALAEALAAFPTMRTNQLASSNQVLLDYWYGTAAPPATAELQQSQVPFIRLQPPGDLPLLRQMPESLLGRNAQTQMLEGKPQVFVDLQLQENIGEIGVSKQMMWIASHKFFPQLSTNDNRPQSDIVEEQLSRVEFNVYAGFLSMPLDQAQRRRYYRMLSFLQTGGIPQEQRQGSDEQPPTLAKLLRQVYKWLFTPESTVAANLVDTEPFTDPDLAQRLAEMISQTSGWQPQNWTVERGGDLDGFIKIEVDFQRVDYLGHLVGVTYKLPDGKHRHMMLINDQQGGVKTMVMADDFSFTDTESANNQTSTAELSSEPQPVQPEPIDWRQKLEGKIIYTFYLRSTPQYFQATEQGRKRILEEMTGSYLPQLSVMLQSRFFTKEHMQRYVLPHNVNDTVRAQALAASDGTAIIARDRPSSVLPSMWRYHAHNPGDILDFHPNCDAWFHAIPPDSQSSYVRSLYDDAENTVRAHMRARLRELGPHQVTLTNVTLTLPQSIPADWNMPGAAADWQLLRQAVEAGEAVFIAHQDQLLHFSSDAQRQQFMELLNPSTRAYDAEIAALVAAETYSVTADRDHSDSGSINVHFTKGMRLLTSQRSQTGIGVFLRASDAYDALHEREAFNQWVSGALRANTNTSKPLQTRHFTLPFAETARRLQVIVPPFVLAYLDPADIRLNQISGIERNPDSSAAAAAEPNWPFRFDHKLIFTELVRLHNNRHSWQQAVAEAMHTREELQRWIPDLVQLGGMPVLPTRNLWYVNAEGNVVTANPVHPDQPYLESIPVPTRTILQGIQVESLPWVLQPGFGGDLAEQLVQPLNTVPLTYFQGQLRGKIEAACYVIPKTIDTINQLSALSGREVRINPELVVGPQEEPRSFWSGLLYTMLQPVMPLSGGKANTTISDTLAKLLHRCNARALDEKHISVKVNAVRGRLELLLANSDATPYLCHVWYIRAAADKNDKHNRQAFVIVGGLSRGALPLIVPAEYIDELPQGEEALIEFIQ